MNFDKLTTEVCVIVEPPGPDGRCSDAAYALAHPGTCPSALLIKPSVINLCLMGSVEFKVFEFKNGTETEVTTGLSFTSSNLDVFPVGVNSGSGTGLEAGNAIVTVTRAADGKTASAKVTVFAEADCCDDIEVSTALVIDKSESASLPFGAGYSTRLDFAKAAAVLFTDPIMMIDDLVAKDQVKLWSLDTETTDILSGFSQDEEQLAAGIATIEQGVGRTDLLLLFTEVAEDLVTETPVVAPPAVPPAIIGNISGVGSPIGVVTPDFLNQFYRDTANNTLYQSTGLTNMDWIWWI